MPIDLALDTDLDLEQLSALFRLLSDKTRLNILLLLSPGEQNVTWLCNELNLPQPTVSHHLGLLRLHNVLDNRRAGKQIFYRINGRIDHDDRAELAIHTDRFVVRIGTAPSQVSTPTIADVTLSP